MSLQKPSPIDAQILGIATLTEMPTQPISIRSTPLFVKQIQQIKVNALPPAVRADSPITTSRRSLGGGAFQVRVQFIAPPDPNYQGVSVFVSSPNGTTRLAASGGKGPLVFNTNQTTAPTSVVVQQNNVNASSPTGLGNAGAKALTLL